MARTIAIAFLLGGLIGVVADAAERAGSFHHPDGTPLARMQFPLAEQPTFEAELTLLEDVFAAKVRNPTPPDYTRDRVYGHELFHAFHLMRFWTNEKFREPLVAHISHSDDFVIECAKAIVAFQDPILRDIVDTRSQYRREPDDGESVWAVLNLQVHVAEQPFQPHHELLPLNAPASRNRFEWPAGITIAGALRQLSHRELSIRVQSWVWLGIHGIIPPTAPILEAWPHLSEEQQEVIAGLEPHYLGRRRLLALYDEVSAHSPESIENTLLVRRVELGNEGAKVRARRTVHLRRKHPAVLLTAPGKSALCALCKSPDPIDIPLLIELYRCDEKWVGHLAVMGLCRIDHPDAIDAIRPGLLSPSGIRDVAIAKALQYQATRDLKYRERYLANLADALRNPDTPPYVFGELVDTFECMSGREFGSSGLTIGQSRVDLAQARKTADRCLEWYSAQSRQD